MMRRIPNRPIRFAALLSTVALLAVAIALYGGDVVASVQGWRAYRLLIRIDPGAKVVTETDVAGYKIVYLFDERGRLVKRMDYGSDRRSPSRIFLYVFDEGTNVVEGSLYYAQSGLAWSGFGPYPISDLERRRYEDEVISRWDRRPSVPERPWIVDPDATLEIDDRGRVVRYCPGRQRGGSYVAYEYRDGRLVAEHRYGGFVVGFAIEELPPYTIVLGDPESKAWYERHRDRYDELMGLAERCTVHPDLLRTTIAYRYDDDGRLLTSFSRHEATGHTITVEFDAHGNPVVETEVERDGTIVHRVRRFRYNDRGDWIARTGYVEFIEASTGRRVRYPSAPLFLFREIRYPLTDPA